MIPPDRRETRLSLVEVVPGTVVSTAIGDTFDGTTDRPGQSVAVIRDRYVFAGEPSSRRTPCPGKASGADAAQSRADRSEMGDFLAR